jgi:hypothetical protein
MEVDNHISNSKFCLTRILSDRGKHPIYQAVARAKSVQELCDILEVEYTGNGVDNLSSRGDSSIAAKAAGGTSHVRRG